MRLALISKQTLPFHFCLAMFSVMMSGLAQFASAQDHPHTPGISGMPHGVPLICENPTATTARSGRWSDPGTWSTGKVPGTPDRIRVDSRHVVTYDIKSDATLSCIEVRGHLLFANATSTRMKVGTIMVLEDGYLEIGNSAKPVAPQVTAEVIVADQSFDGQIDPNQVGNGIVGLGKVTMHGAPKSPTFVRLGGEPLAGQTTLTLEQSFKGWKTGDVLVIPDTRQLRDKERRKNYQSQTEKVRIASIADSRVTLSEPLRFSHLGTRDAVGKLEFLPHVGNVSRNVIVRSENPQGTRGHTIFFSHADVDLRYTQFSELGRTRMGPVDSAQTDSEGRTLRMGTNQIGRYAVHFHHTFGPRTTHANGYQFTLIGNAVDGAPKWGITVHQSHYGLIQDNVVYNTHGAGIVTEDGNESFNVFDHNFSLRSAGAGDLSFASGYSGTGRAPGVEGAAFWFHGPNNYIRRNVAADVDESAFSLPTGSRGLMMRVPAFKGADTSKTSESKRIDLAETPVLEFADNEAYGAIQTGVSWTWSGNISNLVVWNASGRGITGIPIKKLTVDKLIVRGDRSILSDQIESPIGVWLGNYASADVVLRSIDVQSVRVGVFSPFFYGQSGGGEGSLLIEDGYFRSYIGVSIATSYTAYGKGNTPLKKAVVRRSLFEPLDVPALSIHAPETVSMNYGSVPNDPEPRDPILIYDYNKQPGHNFKVYYSHAPGMVVPCHDTVPGIGGWVCKLE